MSNTEGIEISSEMTQKDWQDVAESELKDVTESSIWKKIAFVFEHPEIGLHGFQFIKSSGVLRPCTFKEITKESEGSA